MVTVTRIYKGRQDRLFLEEWMAKKAVDDKILAGRLGVARETVTRYRGQPSRLNTEKLAQVAFALDIEPEDLWRHPERPSLDAIVKDAPEDVQATAADIVRRLVGGR
jgi:DNA-binding Xre family transcriptional regulator